MRLGRKRRLAVGAVVLVALSVPASVAFGAFDVVRPPSTADLRASPLPSGPQVPKLSVGQEQQLRRIVATDVSLQVLLQGSPYAVVRTGPWTDRTSGLVGAVVEIQLPKPINIDSGRWTVLDPKLPPGSKPPYPTTSIVLSVDNLAGLAIMVDFTTGSVAQVTPRLGPSPVAGIAPSPDSAPRIFVPPGYTIPPGPSENEK